MNVKMPCLTKMPMGRLCSGKECSYTLLANELADAAVRLGGLVRGVARSERAQDHEHGHDDRGKDHQLAENGAGVAKLLPLHAALSEVLLQLLAAELVENETTKRNAVTESLEKRDGILEEEHGCEDEENVLENTRERQDERGGLADQEDDRDVEQEGDERVGDKGKTTNAIDVLHSQHGELGEEQDAAVHAGASGRVVVERDERIHLELGRAKQALDHNQADSLKDDATDLEEEADHDELDLAHRSNDNADDNEGNVAEGLHVHRGNAHGPGCDEDSNRGGSLVKSVPRLTRYAGCTDLEHLDEGNTQVQVGLVTADQTQTEEQTDGDNGAEVYAAGHGDLLSRVEDGGKAGEELGHDGREDQMPCCQEDWEVCLSSARMQTSATALRTELGRVQDVLVEDNGARAESDPGAAQQSASACHVSCERERLDVRNVHGGMERGRLRRRLDRVWVDRRQHWLGRVASGVHRGPHFLVGRHGCGRVRLRERRKAWLRSVGGEGKREAVAALLSFGVPADGRGR